MNKKICFKDLSLPLKVLAVCCWVMVGLYALTFIIGFVGGVLGF